MPQIKDRTLKTNAKPQPASNGPTRRLSAAAGEAVEDCHEEPSPDKAPHTQRMPLAKPRPLVAVSSQRSPNPRPRSLIASLCRTRSEKRLPVPLIGQRPNVGPRSPGQGRASRPRCRLSQVCRESDSLPSQERHGASVSGHARTYALLRSLGALQG